MSYGKLELTSGHEERRRISGDFRVSFEGYPKGSTTVSLVSSKVNKERPWEFDWDAPCTLTVDGVSETFDGWKAGAAAAHARADELVEAFDRLAFAVSGLERSKWSFDSYFFRLIEDPKITIGSFDPHSWEVRAGSHSLGEFGTGAEASRAVEDANLLPSDVLDALEVAYSREVGSALFGNFDKAIEMGLIEASDDRRTSLTDEGRRRLDEDPRTVPLAVREAIFERVAATAVKKVDAAGPSADHYVRSLRTVDGSRAALNGYFGGLYSENAIGLNEALANGYALWEDQLRSDPEEICLKGTGDSPRGRASDMTMMIFSPWFEDYSVQSSLLASAISDGAEELAAIYTSSRGRAPEQSPRP